MELYLLFAVTFIFLYTYTIYPFLLWLISLLYPKQAPILPNDAQPLLSHIVPVYNAESNIRQKIENCLALTYPTDKIQFIFVSDCSDDATDNILAEYPQFTILRLEERSGKEIALQRAIQIAKGEIVCFSDVGTLMDKDAMEKVVSAFGDPKIGVISSCDYFDADSFSLENFHIRFEMFIRELEARVTSTVGVSGSFFAARLPICQQLENIHSCSDLEIAFISVRNGFKVKVDPTLFGYYAKTKTAGNEFQRQVRIITHGMSTIASNLDMLNPFKTGLFSWQILSHKIIRWLVPMCVLFFPILALIVLLRSGIDLKNLAIYLSVPFVIGVIGIIVLKKVNFVIRTVSILVVYSLSVFVALYRVLTGQKVKVWNPTKRD